MSKKNKATEPKQTDQNPPKKVGAILADKKINKPINKYINCEKCNRAFKLPSSLAKHTDKCTGDLGVGRKAGGENEKTKEMKAIKSGMQQKIANRVDELLAAQFRQALGGSKLFMREKVAIGQLKRGNAEKGNEQYTWRVSHVTLEADFMIYMSLDHDDRGVAKDSGTGVEYCWMEGKGGNYLALANLLDRAFGRPKESMEIGEDPDAPVGVAGTGTTSDVRALVLQTIKDRIKEGNKNG